MGLQLLDPGFGALSRGLAEVTCKGLIDLTRKTREDPKIGRKRPPACSDQALSRPRVLDAPGVDGGPRSYVRVLT
jgi:hypothetical protein